MKQRFLARMRTALDEIEQNAPTDLALFEYVDLLTAQIPRPTRTIFAAAAEGDMLTTRALLLRHNADVDAGTHAENYDDVTPMYIAAANGHTELVEVLLDHGADVNIPDNSGMLPMHAASEGGHAGAVKILLAAGATTDVHNDYGETPFHAAAEGGHSEIITMLLDHGGLDIEHVTSEPHEYPGSTALMLAAQEGHVEAIKLLLGRGADVNKTDHGGCTPMYAAAAGGHVEVLKLLLDCGVDVNKADNDGQTPLFAASRGGHVAAIKLLLGRGADTSKADDGGETPVYAASKSGKAEAAHVLLKAGADARVANTVGNTAIHAAALCGHLDALCGHLDVVRVLAERWPTNPLAWRMFLMGGGAASELQDYLTPPPNRTTRNHLPRLYSKPDMIKEVYKYLYKPRYADLDQTNGAGNTALQIAEEHGKEEIATLLRELGLG